MKFHDWKIVDGGELQLYDAVSKLFVQHPHLLNGIFDKEFPKLSADPADLLAHYQCLSHGEYVMVKIAIDIWCSAGGARVSELLDILDIHNFSSVLIALRSAREYEIKMEKNFHF